MSDCLPASPAQVLLLTPVERTAARRGAADLAAALGPGVEVAVGHLGDGAHLEAGSPPGEGLGESLGEAHGQGQEGPGGGPGGAPPKRPADVIVARAQSRDDVTALRRRFPASALLVVVRHDGLGPVDAVGLLESGADALTVDPVLDEVSAYVRALLRRRPGVAGVSPA